MNTSQLSSVLVCSIIAALISVATSLWAEHPVFQVADSCAFRTNAAGQSIEITLSKRSFNSKEHEIKRIGKGDTAPLLIDGRLPIGTDDGMPRTEIAAFDVKWNGQKVEVPQALYVDCFNPNLTYRPGKPNGLDSIHFSPSPDGKTVSIEMHGSDGIGTYNVKWLISSDGKHRRSVCDDAP